MGLIYRVAVINQEGQLIYSFEKNISYPEIEKTFSYPLDIQLKLSEKGNRVVVEFGERDGIKIDHAVVSVNGHTVSGHKTSAGVPILEMLNDPANFPGMPKNGKMPTARINAKVLFSGGQVFPVIFLDSESSLASSVIQLHTTMFESYTWAQ